MKRLTLMLAPLLLTALSVSAGDCSDWRPIETAPKNGYPVLISAGSDGPAWAGKYRTTYLAYWAEHMSADGAKEWRDVSTHRPLPYKAFKWMPLPKEQP